MQEVWVTYQNGFLKPGEMDILRYNRKLCWLGNNNLIPWELCGIKPWVIFQLKPRFNFVAVIILTEFTNSSEMELQKLIYGGIF